LREVVDLLSEGSAASSAYFAAYNSDAFIDRNWRTFEEKSYYSENLKVNEAMKKSKKSAREDTGSKAFSQKVPKHHHCPVCGKPISLDKEVCSKECEARFKKVRWGRVMPFIIIFVAIIYMIIRWIYQF